MSRVNVTNLKAHKAHAFSFRLYVAGDAHNSSEAQTNLGNLCSAFLPGRHTIEVIDVFSEPLRALEDGVFMTPTLMKLSPAPSRRIVGTLSDTDTVLLALGLMKARV